MTTTGVALASPMGATVKAAQRCKHKHDDKVGDDDEMVVVVMMIVRLDPHIPD